MGMGTFGIERRPVLGRGSETGQTHYSASQLSALLLLVVGPGAQGPLRGSWAHIEQIVDQIRHQGGGGGGLGSETRNFT